MSAVGLLPLLLFPPSHPGVRLLLLLLMGLYFFSKYGQLRQAQRGLKQLRLEDRFLRQRFSTVQLRQMIPRSDHLWGPSLVLRGLRELQERPLPGRLRNDEKMLRIVQRYRRAFTELRPTHNSRDLLLLLPILALWLSATPLSSLDHAAVLVQSGLLAASIMALAELVQLATLWALGRDFTRYEQALGAWTVAEDWAARLRQPTPGYTHTPLYQARPGFADPRGPAPRGLANRGPREVA